jgi:hypothetical protein
MALRAAALPARVDQIYKVKMADLQGHLQEILSQSSYVQLLVLDVMYDVIISVDRCWR